MGFSVELSSGEILPLSQGQGLEVERLCCEPYQFLEEIKRVQALVCRTDLTASNFPFDPSFLYLDVCPCQKLSSFVRTQKKLKIHLQAIMIMIRL